MVEDITYLHDDLNSDIGRFDVLHLTKVGNEYLNGKIATEKGEIKRLIIDLNGNQNAKFSLEEPLSIFTIQELRILRTFAD